MTFIDDIENSAKWVDENYSKIPPSINSVIADTVKDYLKKYEHAEYMFKDDRREMIKWKIFFNIH